MEEKTAKALTKALDANTDAMKDHTKALNAVLKASGRKTTGGPAGQGPTGRGETFKVGGVHVDGLSPSDAASMLGGRGS